MDTKKVAINILLILILSTAFTIFNPTSAQIDDALKQKAEVLVGILSDTNMSIVSAFSRLNVQNITLPIAETKYTEGIAHAEEVARLMNQKNFTAACIEAVEAMQKFKETLRILDTASPVELTESEVTAEEIITLKARITRAMGYLKRLENLTARAAIAGYNTGVIENRLTEIKHHLENATRELYSRNLTGATEEFYIAKKLVNELKESLDRLTNLVTISNTQRYLKEAEVRVSEAKANVTLSSTLSPEAKDDAISALNNSEISLANARDSIENNDFNEAIEELEEAKKWEEESSRIISAVAATPLEVALTPTSITQTKTTLSK